MADFKSRFDIGDHTWDVVEGYHKKYGDCSFIVEDIVSEVIFGYTEPHYRLRILDDGNEEYSHYPESEFFATPEEAAKTLDSGETFYIRCGLADPGEGVRVDINK